MKKIHTLAGRFGDPRDILSNHRRLPIEEHVPFAQLMAETAQTKCAQGQHKKVPRWILRSALYFLSLGPLSPPSIIADSLAMVAMDFGCDVSQTPTRNEKYVQI
jgi:hypothetical protein